MGSYCPLANTDNELRGSHYIWYGGGFAQSIKPRSQKPVAKQRFSKHVQTNKNNGSGVLFVSDLRSLIGSRKRANGLPG
jgi:hypothetical protein